MSKSISASAVANLREAYVDVMKQDSGMRPEPLGIPRG